MRAMSLLAQVAPVRIMPCGIEVRGGHSVAARDVLRLPRAPEDLRHSFEVISKDNHLQRRDPPALTTRPSLAVLGHAL